MKAAVVHQKGEMPQYSEFPDPIAQKEDQIVVTVKAAAIKHLDKSRASGKHYSTEGKEHKPTVPGGDGVGVLPDGTKVYALGATGMIAEKAVIEKDRMVPLPAGLDDAIAASLPNAVAGSALALRFRANMQVGETVLINGATGFTGKMAVQIAKLYGAKKIIVTGRNEASLQSLLALGANEIISLQQDDEAIISQIKAIHQSTPIDIILDYVWGHPASLLLASLKGQGSFTHKVRYVSIGSMAGDSIPLSAQMLRSVDIQLSGSGIGSWSREEVKLLFSDILPEMFQLAADNKLVVETEKINLADIEHLWDKEVSGGKRLVVMM
jgi:NADPH:quinone reductase-like Zn-dependent oxidoreductase